MNNFAYQREHDVNAAIAKVASGIDSKFIAGGTNVIDLLKYNLTIADTLVDINLSTVIIRLNPPPAED